MRKFFIGFVLVAFVFSGAACASPDTDNRENDSMARTMNISEWQNPDCKDGG